MTEFEMPQKINPSYPYKAPEGLEDIPVTDFMGKMANINRSKGVSEAEGLKFFFTFSFDLSRSLEENGW